jgi:hypothetical protein
MYSAVAAGCCLSDSEIEFSLFAYFKTLQLCKEIGVGTKAGRKLDARFQAFTSENVKTAVFWDVTPVVF